MQEIIVYIIGACTVGYIFWKVFGKKKRNTCAGCTGCSNTKGCNGCSINVKKCSGGEPR